MNTVRHFLLPLAAAFALGACDSSEAPSAPTPRQAPSVATRLAAVAQEELTRKMSFDGEVANLYSPDVAAEIAGKVVSVHVEPGQRVRKGALLFSIDSSDVTLAAAADRSEEARLSAFAADKAANLQRLTQLADKELVSRAALSTARQDAAAAAEAVKTAAARAGLSARTAAKAQVRAPFDGEVVDRKAAPGSYVRPGDVLASLVRPDASFVKVFVPETLVAQLQPGMPAQVSVAGEPAFESKVTAIHQRANRASRTVEVVVASGERLRPGSSARVTLTLSRHTGLVVPETAVATEGTSIFVYVVTENKARKTPVKLGVRFEGKAELLTGVKTGDLVAQDAAFMFDGAVVRGAGQ